jgi:hypothetical protein
MEARYSQTQQQSLARVPARAVSGPQSPEVSNCEADAA